MQFRYFVRNTLAVEILPEKHLCRLEIFQDIPFLKKLFKCVEATVLHIAQNSFVAAAAAVATAAAAAASAAAWRQYEIGGGGGKAAPRHGIGAAAARRHHQWRQRRWWGRMTKVAAVMVCGGEKKMFLRFLNFDSWQGRHLSRRPFCSRRILRVRFLSEQSYI